VVVLSRDPLTKNPATLDSLRVQRTDVDGELAYEAARLPCKSAGRKSGAQRLDTRGLRRLPLDKGRGCMSASGPR
jgi:hypothetical protein